MTFYWGKDMTLLVDSWKIQSTIAYLLTLLACFLFSALYQYLEDRRIRFKSPTIHARFATSLLFGVNSAMGYLIMLSVMSFNGAVFVAIVFGLSTGYFLFSAANEYVVVVDNPCASA
ncbi:copper transporter 5 [Cannabis sativa]|nr:copper transporter 5 [Cannabis sativa]